MINIPNYSSNLVKAKVELYDGSALVETCTCDKYLQEFTLAREGELGKFFGFGVCHSLTMKLIDIDKKLRLYEGFTSKICLGDGTNFYCPYPELEITTVSVDKKSGDITVEAYDALFRANEVTLDDLKKVYGLSDSYTLRALAQACATSLGLSVTGFDAAFNLSFPAGANYNGDESVRTILNQIAEATQTIYYVNNNKTLVFKRLVDSSVHTYDSDDFYEFETGAAKVLRAICNATELGENMIEEDTQIVVGVTQYVRDNGLWELREDLESLLATALNRVSGLTLEQFNLDWSGDYRLEVGDCIKIDYDDGSVNVFILNDIITYDGTFNEQTSWEYAETKGETFSNPTNIGEKINQTFARVDKLEKNITLYVGDVVEEVIPAKIEEALKNFDVEGLEELQKDVDDLEAVQTTTTQKVTQLELTTEGITGDVSTLKQSNTTITNQLGDVVAEQTTIKNNISSLQQKDNEISASIQELSTNIVTKTYVDEQIEEAAGDAKDYTDAEVTETVTLINTKVAEIKATTDSITQRVSAEETKTVEFDSALNALDRTTTQHTSDISELILESDSISASVTSIREDTMSSVESLNQEISSLSKRVDATITSEDVNIAIQSKLDNGIDKITTSTGYTFDADGLHISKSTSQMESTLNEDGLVVSRYDTPVLTAQSDGVNALNITVRQYLKIGGSRFEDMGSRVGCFWVG